MTHVRTYNPHVRVGNWNEDLKLEEDKLKDFLKRKENGGLNVNQTEKYLAQVLKKVDLSYEPDNYVRYGSLVQLRNESTNAVLAAERTGVLGDISEHGYSITTTTNESPCVRNSFVITRIGEKKPGDDDVLCYGDKFAIAVHPDFSPDFPLYIKSERVSFATFAKKSRHQEVTLTGEPTFHITWQILHADPQQRMETEGMPIKAGERLVICHAHTHQSLASSNKFVVRNYYGAEFEAHGHTYLDTHRAEQRENHWNVVLASLT
eukprot:Colp12_sorted_trinity150504_noHs@4116